MTTHILYKKRLKIGLTGGIGSGKTTIANIFSTLGIPVYDADLAAKQLMNTNEQIREQLILVFGPEAYQNGQLDRRFVATRAFDDAQKLKSLNAITHPATIQDSIDWFSRQQTAYAIKEAALIFESHSEQYLDYVIGVWAEKELRIERVMKRSGLTENEIRSRMERQMDEQLKMERCDFVIDNNGRRSVLEQVVALHKKLLNLANR